MKKVIGIILLVLAAFATINAIKTLSQPARQAPTRSAAYDSGRKAGSIFAPVLFGGLGLWLVLSSGSRRKTPPPLPTASVSDAPAEFAPPKPWFKTTPAIIGFSVAGTLVGLIVLLIAVGVIARASRRSSKPRINAPPPIQTPAARPESPAKAGPYNTGDSIEANWGGKWTSGKITRVNPGGFNVMVQLEDARFPQPIVLSTNQIRPK